jgi:hypothetical protein
MQVTPVSFLIKQKATGKKTADSKHDTTQWSEERIQSSRRRMGASKRNKKTPPYVA